MSTYDEDRINQQIQEEFFSEGSELLGFVEDLLVDLEQSPNDEVLHSKIFRYIHTLKGSGYSAGFSSLAEFTHQFEAVLGKIRSKELSANAEIIDLLLKSNDVISRHINDLLSDPSTVLEKGPIFEKLKSFSGKSEEVTTNQPTGLFLFEEIASDESTTPSDTNSNYDSVPLQILVVDDEKDIRDIISEICEGVIHNCIIDQAEDGKKGLEQIEKNRYDLVITDLNMPHDGLTFIKNIRSKKIDVPITVASGYGERENLIKCIKLGIDNFIEKPIEQEIIELSIKNSLKGKLLKDKSHLLIKQAFATYMSFQKYLIEKEEMTAAQAKEMFDIMEGNCRALAELAQKIFLPETP